MKAKKNDIPIQYEEITDLPEFLTKKGITKVKISELSPSQLKKISSTFVLLYEDELYKALAK